MIKITEKYFIDADSKNYILKEKSIIKDEKSENCGKEFFKDLGYFRKLENVFDYIFELNIKEYIGKSNNKTVEQLLNKIKRVEKEINKQFNMYIKSED